MNSSITVTAFDFSDEKQCDIAFNIRTVVFVDEQKVSHPEEFDGLDSESKHYLVYVNEIPVGTARWRYTDKGIKLERFAVLKQYRNTGAGTEMLKKVLEDVKNLNRKIYLHAQVPALNFYLRQGFIATGNMFLEADIEHYKMVWEIER